MTSVDFSLPMVHGLSYILLQEDGQHCSGGGGGQSGKLKSGL